MLTDSAGESFNLKTDTRARLTLVFFGYTHCPDVCPTTVADVTAALRRVPPEVRDQVQFIFITTDPARDTPEVLREYLDRFDDSHVGLTGSLATIEQVARRLGVPLTGKKKLPSGGYEVGHGSQVIAFGSDDRARMLWLGGTSVGDYQHDITKLVRTG
ncbi:MAG: SCO family protein [Streptosporangiales bacterium]|nr:SCO family protein [Streptosporangiales bacterium]